ncbi:hypothetical protein PZT57_25975 [Pseudomonas aeruginosa]|uniref:hypothetical protein n=1 Tax=Pseudomonas aeruginosa TaxID=287 RepID=UPI002B269274|nr:hypothetical protein [Pseudomonas aeruginosa]MEA8592095.1 hypothetical protein [Pseudomonas aeruginosa]
MSAPASSPITLNHFQLKSLLEDSEMYGVEPTDVQSVVVLYRSADDIEAYAGPGLYSSIEGVDLVDGSYLAVDSQDQDRAIAIREKLFQQELRECEAIEASIREKVTANCKSKASCMDSHGAAWLFHVPPEAKACKGVGRCLCDEYRNTPIEIELEIPLEP